MNAESIIVDGVEYQVYIVFPSRELSFEIKEGSNTGMSLAFREIRDIGGTAYSYIMQAQPRPGHQADFDALFWALSAPVDSHRVIMPFGQGTLEFDAVVRSGRILDYGVSAGIRKWTGMEISVTPIEPQRKPE